MKRQFISLVSAAWLLAAWLAAPVVAQETNEDLRQEIAALKQGQEDIQRQIDLEKEINELKQGQEEIKKQLEELKKLVQQRPAAAPRPSGPNVEGKVFNLGDNPVKGAQTAKLTLVEFTDYQ